jgi:uncharacterized membrane protein
MHQPREAAMHRQQMVRIAGVVLVVSVVCTVATETYRSRTDPQSATASRSPAPEAIGVPAGYDDVVVATEEHSTFAVAAYDGVGRRVAVLLITLLIAIGLGGVAAVVVLNSDKSLAAVVLYALLTAVSFIATGEALYRVVLNGVQSLRDRGD